MGFCPGVIHLGDDYLSFNHNIEFCSDHFSPCARIKDYNPIQSRASIKSNGDYIVIKSETTSKGGAGMKVGCEAACRENRAGGPAFGSADFVVTASFRGLIELLQFSICSFTS